MVGRTGPFRRKHELFRRQDWHAVRYPGHYMAGIGLTENILDWSGEPLPPVAIATPEEIAGPEEVAGPEQAAASDEIATLDEIAPADPSPVSTSLLAEIADETNPLSAFGAEPERKLAEPEPEAFSSEASGEPLHETRPAVETPRVASHRPLLLGIAAALTLGALVVVWLLQAGTSADSISTVTGPPASIPDATGASLPPSQSAGSNVAGATVTEPVATSSATVAPSPAVASPTVPPSTPGSLIVKSPALLQVLQRGRVVGMTDAERITLPPGRHALSFVSEELGFRAERRVTIGPGAATTLNVELPSAPLAINAQPWAEVWVDDERVGETPIGNLTRTIGTHEVVFRHPSLGERRVSVLVTLKEPARVSVDLRAGN